MIKFLLWCLLLACCWPVAIAFLFVLPLIWLILLPFKLAGLAIHMVFALFTLPFKVVKLVF
jgi:hypothetical protein